MFSHAWKSISAKNGAVQKFYSQYKTAFTVVTTLVGTSAAWASYFARAKHNQKLEKDIEHINQSIAEIPKKTNNMYDRMDMIILGSSALVVGYLTCAVKHKTVNYYRYWNARKAVSKTMKIGDPAVSSGLVSKEEIRTLEKNEHHLFRYYFQSCKQTVCSLGTLVANSVGSLFVKTGQLLKSSVAKNPKLLESTKALSHRISSVVHHFTNIVSTRYNNLMYRYNLYVIEKKHAKSILDGEKEVINKANMSSVME